MESMPIKAKKTIIVGCLLLVVCCLLSAAPAFASLLPTCPQQNVDCSSAAWKDNCACCGGCQLTDALKVVLTVSDIMVKILGVVALVFFVYGGFIWVISAGDSNKIKQGQQILIGTIVGMIIVLAAYAAVKFLEDSLNVREEFRFDTSDTVK
jgi:hypothetical protein